MLPERGAKVREKGEEVINHPAMPTIEWDDMDPYREGAEAAFRSVAGWLYGECGDLKHGQAIRRHRILCPKCMNSLKEAVK
jgi:hypothetical protein